MRLCMYVPADMCAWTLLITENEEDCLPFQTRDQSPTQKDLIIILLRRPNH